MTDNAHSIKKQEQREAYAEAILDAAGPTPLGLEFRYALAEACAEVEDLHTADLRAEIERLRTEIDAISAIGVEAWKRAGETVQERSDD